MIYISEVLPEYIIMVESYGMFLTTAALWNTCAPRFEVLKNGFGSSHNWKTQYQLHGLNFRFYWIVNYIRTEKTYFAKNTPVSHLNTYYEEIRWHAP